MSETKTKQPAATPPAATPPALQKRALDRNFGVASFKFNRYSYELTEQQTLDDALVPSFWASQVEKVMGHDKGNPRGRGDVIEIRQLHTGLYAELIVLELGTGFIKVQPIRAWQPTVTEIAESSPLTTRWNAGKKSHEVIRKSDNSVMQGGFQTQPSAAAWIADHLKALAA